MGTSNWQNISFSVGLIRDINPQKILDVGIGFGKWGFLCREYLDLWDGNYTEKDWEVQIDGIEIFEKYIQEHQRKIYTNIIVDDALNYITATKNKYNLIIIGDVLEHFSKDRAHQLLEHCTEKSDFVLINLPIGKYWKQNVVFENINERHLSFWNHKELKKYQIVSKKRFYYTFLRPYSVILLSKNKKKLKKNKFFTKEVKLFIYSNPIIWEIIKYIREKFSIRTVK